MKAWDAATLDRFVSLLERQHVCYRAMEELTLRQEQTLQAGDGDGLVEIAEQKSRRLLEVDSVEHELAPLRERWNASHEGVPAEARARLEAAVERVRTVLQALVQAEARWQSVVEGAQAKAGAELKQVETARRVHRAYGNQAGPPGGSRFIDERP